VFNPGTPANRPNNSNILGAPAQPQRTAPQVNLNAGEIDVDVPAFLRRGGQ